MCMQLNEREERHRIRKREGGWKSEYEGEREVEGRGVLVADCGNEREVHKL